MLENLELKDGAAPAPAGRWLRVELMGHQVLTGLVTEVDEFGVRMLRAQSLCPDGHMVDEVTVNPRTALYGFRPFEEARARKGALELCHDASHRVWCTGCGLSRLGGRRSCCTACGYPSVLMVAPDSLTAAELPSYGAQWNLVRNAGAEPVPAAANADGAAADHYSATFEFYNVMNDAQREEATAWALAVHRQRLGEEGVVVPPRPDFLRDVSAETLADEDGDDHDDDDGVPY